MTTEQLSWMAGVVTFVGVLLTASLRLIVRELAGSEASDSERRDDFFSRMIIATPLLGRSLRSIRANIQALKQSEADHRTRYKILTDHVAAAVILHQSDGTILWCSPFTEVLTGYPLSEVYRKKETFLKSFVHEEDRQSLERALAIVATGEPFQCRYRFYHRSGMTLWLETRTVPIFDSSVNEYVALSIAIDVTAHVLNQLHIEGRNRDLHEFTYMISHDLKAPILTIKGMLGILSEIEALQTSQESSEPLSYIAKAVTRLEQLVQGVLELARVSASEQPLVGVDLNPLFQEVQHDYETQIKTSHSSIEVEPELPPVLGTSTYLYQIFSNLLGNALKYRDPERPLVFTVSSLRAASKRKVQIVVKDTGRGISADKLDLVFKPFHRIGEESIEGSGVGLASVKKLVEKIGGSIRVESSLGVGTTFTIELRRAPDLSLGQSLDSSKAEILNADGEDSTSQHRQKRG